MTEISGVAAVRHREAKALLIQQLTSTPGGEVAARLRMAQDCDLNIVPKRYPFFATFMAQLRAAVDFATIETTCALDAGRGQRPYRRGNDSS
jgi:hypothetical protein